MPNCAYENSRPRILVHLPYLLNTLKWRVLRTPGVGNGDVINVVAMNVWQFAARVFLELSNTS